jgi:hypothetical protein
MLEDVVLWLLTRLLFFAVPITLALICGASVAWLIKRKTPSTGSTQTADRG